MGAVIFNGISSLDYGIQVEQPPDYIFPERDYEIQHIPGRNGDLVLDKGSYKNVERVYKISIGSLKVEHAVLANRISEWLHSASGYARLEDSYEPEYFRLAMYKENGTIENIHRHGGKITVTFDCKPQRFLKSGEEPLLFQSSGLYLQNPTSFRSLPKITVNGSGGGTLRIGEYTVILSEIGGSVTIDCDIQDAYHGPENRNSTISLPNGFPKLWPGEVELSFSGGITFVEVIPRWWTL